MTRTVTRDTFIQILEAALGVKNYRFARQSADLWLQHFPGDLQSSFLLAKAWFYEGNSQEAAALLEKICLLDPEYLEAWCLLIRAFSHHDQAKAQEAAACAYSLGSNEDPSALPLWCSETRAARNAFQSGNFEEMNRRLQVALSQGENHAQTDILHLLYVLSCQDATTYSRLVRLYSSRYPQCLQLKLALADSQMGCGDEIAAVSLMHQCVAQDAAGQVATRLWGDGHKYRPLWPDSMEIDFDLPIPSEVSAVFGWNRLPRGKEESNVLENTNNHGIKIDDQFIPQSNKKDSCDQRDLPEFLRRGALPNFVPVSRLNSDTDLSPVETNQTELSNQDNEISREDNCLQGEKLPTIPLPWEEDNDPVANVFEQSKSDHLPQDCNYLENEKFDSTLESVEKIFKNMAQKVNRPDVGQSDGRFPIYVILSTGSGLLKTYGAHGKQTIVNEMTRLSEVICKRTGWGALTFLPDEKACVLQLGLQPINSNDPWKIKLALSDLDQILAKKGEMIGAVLIVGGPDVVPFHSLPNPTDDMDDIVLSDNPYASADSNYFVPEFPVGRLPGERGGDCGFLINQLQAIIQYHNSNGRPGYWFQRFPFPLNLALSQANRIVEYFGKKNGKKHCFGYTAAIWRRSSIAVFRPIGQADGLLVSPPLGSGYVDSKSITDSRLGYFNLHGIEDGSEWFGQRDVIDTGNGVDYPVALKPEDLVKKGQSPQLVFSEACYGGYVVRKQVNESIALKFLSIGTKVVIGSTCIAYGSVSTPLIGADLLGYLFWKYIKEGSLVGEAFMRAKIDFAKEMNKRQGYLDGEDQKTLISFVYFGDPLVANPYSVISSKRVNRPKTHDTYVTVSDHQNNLDGAKRVTKEMLGEVKKSLEMYLPGLDDARVSFCKQVTNASENSGRANGRGSDQKGQKNSDTGNMVVTVRKQIEDMQKTHIHYARITLNSAGKMVKLAISR